jgi:hypothetical protein
LNLEVFPETPELSLLKVIQVVLIGIRFPFKRNPQVGPVRIFQFIQPIIIFDHIEDIKENNQHLRLLLQVDFFVINQYVIFLIFGIPNEDKWEKSNAADF